MKRKTLEEFIDNARKIHGDKYSYDKSVYVDNKTKLIVTCPIHGDFLMRPDKHLWQKRGCSKCNGGVGIDTEEFKKRAAEKHHDKYDYSLVEYVNATTPIKIICPEHGIFEQKAGSHIVGKGCPICGGSMKLSTEQFIERSKMVHGDKYDYSLVNYKNNGTKVTIICPKHGEFMQTPFHHMDGVGCPHCKRSTLEEATSKYLTEKGIDFIGQHDFDWLGRLSLDFYIPSLNIAIECQGEQHFRPVDFAGNGKEWAETEYKKLVERDACKKRLCEENGVILKYINYDEDVEKALHNILDKAKTHKK